MAPFPIGPYRPSPFRIRGSEQDPGERAWHWTRTVMLVGFFACMASLPTVGSWTMLGWGTLARALTFFCVIGLLLFPWRFYQRFLGIDPLETFLFNVMGMGPFLFSLLLWSNFIFHGPAEEEVHRIEEREFVGQMLNPVYRYRLRDSAYQQKPEYRRFSVKPSNGQRLEQARWVRYRKAKGLFGIPVMLQREARLKPKMSEMRMRLDSSTGKRFVKMP